MSSKLTTKAVDYLSTDTLLQLDPHHIEALDFTGFPERHRYAKLNQIIPKNPRYGKVDPPPHYLTSGKKVREWQKIGRSNHLHAIDNSPQALIPWGSSQRAVRQNRGRDLLSAPDQNESALDQLAQVAAAAAAVVASRKEEDGFWIRVGRRKNQKVTNGEEGKQVDTPIDA